MSELSRTKRERAFIAGVQAEIAGGMMQFDRETVRKLIGAYHAELYRFDCLALDVAYDIEHDNTFLATNYGEFTTTRNRMAEVDAIGMRDQIDRDDAKEAPDGN